MQENIQAAQVLEWRCHSWSDNKNLWYTSNYSEETQKNASSIYEKCSKVKMVCNQEMENELATRVRDLDSRFHGLTPRRCAELAFEYDQKKAHMVKMPQRWIRNNQQEETGWATLWNATTYLFVLQSQLHWRDRVHLTSQQWLYLTPSLNNFRIGRSTINFFLTFSLPLLLVLKYSLINFYWVHCYWN